MDAEPVIIQTAVSTDGKKRWHLLQRSDGFVTYDEDTFFTEDLSEFDAGIMEYWSPTRFSGLFDTVVEARTDALGTLVWLKEVLSAE
ncbi:hypothetical protein [Sphingomonas sp. STIS6.2]|uniref:hypothetical protein n=1 Tax=Sphingomonas sp. STIS6.2 TaxID=1379700 RepID=UPI0004DB6CEB|nr:hypothetical protein [Sphingomonas sp. STIS6.2]